jgi:hypothetical protein
MKKCVLWNEGSESSFMGKKYLWDEENQTRYISCLSIIPGTSLAEAREILLNYVGRVIEKRDIAAVEAYDKYILQPISSCWGPLIKEPDGSYSIEGLSKSESIDWEIVNREDYNKAQICTPGSGRYDKKLAGKLHRIPYHHVELWFPIVQAP